MRQFRFRVLEMKDSSPQEWLRLWADRYQEDDEKEYRDLIAKHKSLSREDFELIGKWKDGVTTERQWRSNVASVAYLIWKQAARELPGCPEEGAVKAFLKDWSDRRYTDVFRNKSVEKRFGLARATALLHFVSGGRYPIFDSPVRAAVARLISRPELPGTVDSYWDSFLPLFKELAASCSCQTTDDLRMLDKALFSYGALKASMFSN